MPVWSLLSAVAAFPLYGPSVVIAAFFALVSVACLAAAVFEFMRGTRRPANLWIVATSAVVLAWVLFLLALAMFAPSI